MSEDFDSIREGDKVALSRGWSSGYEIASVVRVTEKQIVITKTGASGNSYEEKFWKKNGNEVGGSSDIWSGRTRITPVTTHVIESIEIQKLKEQARKLRDNLGIPQTKDELVEFISAIEPLVSK